MKRWSDKTHRLFQLAVNHKHQQRLRELGIEVVATTLGFQPLVITMKVDGEHNIFEFDGEKVILANHYGTMRSDITPMCSEFAGILRKRGITHLLGAGELYAVMPDGSRMPLNMVMHYIKAPAPEEEKQIRFAVFDLFEVDHKRMEGKYYERILWLNRILGEEPKTIHTVFAVEGDVNVVKDLWQNKVTRPGGWEGLVIHADGSFKVKNIGTIDAVVIGANEGEGKASGMLGALVVALMDKEGYLLYAGKAGTGFSDRERVDWWHWVHQNKIEQTSDGTIYVKPIRVIEMGYETIITHSTPAFKWDGARYSAVMERTGGVMQKPRFYRIREDKKLNYDDLRVEQIPVSVEPGKVSTVDMRQQALAERFAKIKRRVG